MIERAEKIINLLEEAYQDVGETSLNWETPLDLLVATILSAQSTDVQINKVTETLFKKYRTAADYAHAPREQLEEAIRSSGFYRRRPSRRPAGSSQRSTGERSPPRWRSSSG